MAWNASYHRTLSLIWSACSILVSSSSIFTTSSCLALMSKTRRSTKVNPLSFSLPLSHRTQLLFLHPESQRNHLSSFCTLAGDVKEGSLQFEETMEFYIQWNTITVLLRCWQDPVTKTQDWTLLRECQWSRVLVRLKETKSVKYLYLRPLLYDPWKQMLHWQLI